MLNSELINASQECQKSSEAGRTKPRGLVVRRSNGKIQECSGLIPDAVIIAGDYAKLVFPRAQPRIERLPTRVSVLPVVIDPGYLVPKSTGLRNRKTQRGVAYLEAAG